MKLQWLLYDMILVVVVVIIAIIILTILIVGTVGCKNGYIVHGIMTTTGTSIRIGGNE